MKNFIFLTKAKSARGLAHSKTLSRGRERQTFRQVLECASPLALWRQTNINVAVKLWQSSGKAVGLLN
jgi:hypothetical protein